MGYQQKNIRASISESKELKKVIETLELTELKLIHMNNLELLITKKINAKCVT